MNELKPSVTIKQQIKIDTSNLHKWLFLSGMYMINSFNLHQSLMKLMLE